MGKGSMQRVGGMPHQPSSWSRSSVHNLRRHYRVVFSRVPVVRQFAALCPARWCFFFEPLKVAALLRRPPTYQWDIASSWRRSELLSLLLLELHSSALFCLACPARGGRHSPATGGDEDKRACTET